MTAVALEATRIRVRTSTLLAGAVVVIATLVAWWANMPYVVGVWHDDGVYALLGRAIAAGQGFHYTQFPGAPAATHYPPLYPLLLAVVWRLAPSFPDNIAAFLAVNAVLVGVAALGMSRFLSRRLGWRDEAAAGLALLASLTTPILALSGAVLSESLFLAACWPALAAAERAVAPDAGRRDAVTAGAVIGVLMLVRTHAVALALALALVLVTRRRSLDALLAIVSALVIVMPWQLWTMFATPRVPALFEGAYGSYLGWFVTGVREGGIPFVAATARLNLTELWLLVQDRVIPADAAFPRILAAAFLLVLVAIGAWALSRRAPVTAWFLAAYLAIVVVWPYTPWRFLWVVWPIVLMCAAVGAWWLWHASAPSRTRVLAALVVALPAFGMLRTEWYAYEARAWAAPAIQAGAQITPIVAWVGRNTAQSDIVLAEGEQVVTLFTGRLAGPTASFSALEYVVPRSRAASTAELRTMIAQTSARYVLPLAPEQLEAARALAGERPGLRPVAALPRSTVFEVVR
ncbi:MAG TPA: hypothetical protein VFI52_10580 [Gemmatimonadaceae bacterium]|nr:hypothetical protein [Gemmatimonadaceae bacterium]